MVTKEKQPLYTSPAVRVVNIVPRRNCCMVQTSLTLNGVSSPNIDEDGDPISFD